MKSKNCHNSPKALAKSPFMIATAAGALVIGADILWLSGELLTHFEIFSHQFYVYWRFMIMALLISGLLFCFVGLKAYLANGYMRFEHKHELEYKKELQSQVKRDKIFK
jgi:hypothetical protein